MTWNEKEVLTQELGDSGIYVNRERLEEQVNDWCEQPDEEKGSDLVAVGIFGIIAGIVCVAIGNALKNE